MATTSAPNKTAFVRGLLEADPKATTKIVNEKWSSSGFEGTVSETLVQNLRSKMGLTGNIRKGTGRKASAKGKRRVGRPAASRSTPPAAVASTPAKKISSAPPKVARAGDLEAQFDNLLYTVMQHGEMADVEDALRHARRLLILRQKG